jgi:hypothetical protein
MEQSAYRQLLDFSSYLSTSREDAEIEIEKHLETWALDAEMNARLLIILGDLLFLSLFPP